MGASKVVVPDKVELVVTAEKKPAFGAGVDASVDMNSVASILVVAKEENLLVKEKELRAEKHELDKKLAAANKKVELEAQRVVKSSVTTKKDKAVIASLVALGFNKSTTKVERSYTGISNSNGRVLCAIDVKVSDDYQGTVKTSCELKASAALKKLQKAVSVVEKSRDKTNKELTSVLRDLQNMGRHERQAKAAVAITNLQQSKEGKKFLGEMQKNVKRLPGMGA